MNIVKQKGRKDNKAKHSMSKEVATRLSLESTRYQLLSGAPATISSPDATILYIDHSLLMCASTIDNFDVFEFSLKQ